ncbi:MAG TPA: HEPN domain-containing protein [Bacteroidales bacterium]|nr:HEPN domain-containing protein [Bacteroidales bacterium]
MKEEKREYIRYRLETARKTFEAASILAENGFWNSAVNRLYYALFYSVNALLYLSDISAKKHSSVKSQFTLHFVKTGKFDKKYGQLLSELFDWRQRGDYDNIFDYDRELVMPLFHRVDEMLNLIESFIKKEMD